MDTHTTDRATPKARAVRPDCCADETCPSGSRNNYYLGKRLTPDAFRAEQQYLVERRQLLNRAIHGWGVVYGFPVAMAAADESCPGAEKGRLEIGEGLALDKMGRELVQTGPVALTLENVILLDSKDAPVRASGCDEKGRMWRLEPDTDACWRLSAHYAEQGIGPVTLKDAYGCERKEWDRVCETVCYSLQRVDCSECCIDQACELQCDCATGPCCKEPSAAGGDVEKEKLRDRGGCDCLCKHLSGLQLGAECHLLCEVDGCVRVDLRNGVALACVTLDQDDCGNWRFASVYDACGPRRLVKRNDLLFDLIRGCDVTRISEIGWGDWHRGSVSFEEFSKAFGQPDNDKREYVTDKFWVKFSRPVLRKTVLADCFAMTVLGAEQEGGWWQTFRVPIVRVETTPESDPDLVREAKIVVDGAWLEDAVRGRKSIFWTGETRVELEVRGDFIIDCNQQTLDANARGLLPFPSGSDGPGDAFLSTFTVAKRKLEGVTS